MWKISQISLNAPPIDTWPTVLEDALNNKSREKFKVRQQAIKLYFDGEGYSSIQVKTGICSKSLSRLAKKCLKVAPDGKIFGFRALIPHIRTDRHSRKSPFKSKRTHQKGGQSGALGDLLSRFPDLEDRLIKIIRQHAKRNEIPEFNIKPKSLHKIFLESLEDKKLSWDEWPFNTQYLGYRSIQGFMKDIIERNFVESINNREEKDAVAHTFVGTGFNSFLSFHEPYDAVEIDAYKIEAHLTVAFLTPEGTETEVLLERIWLISVIDRASSAILAYTIVYRSEVTADDVVSVIRSAVNDKWEPKKLTIPNLKYPSKGGLPSGVIPAAHGAAWSVTMLDGALAHLADKVREGARRRVGFVLNWGPAGHFERRPNVERFFKKFGQDVVRRLPSTTGSNPYAGRAPDAEAKAIKFKIRAAELEEVIDVYIAQHNAEPSEGLSFLSPLAFIQYFLESESPRTHARKLPDSELGRAKAFSCIEKKRVRGSMTKGRRPYIQIDRVRYTSPLLASAGFLISQNLLVEIDEEDMRQVRAYLENGSELGFLKAHGKWSLTKHSRRTRRAINSLISQKIIVVSEFDDPIRLFLAHLSSPEKRKGKEPSIRPKDATQATRVAKEAGVVPMINMNKSIGKERTNKVPSVSDVLKRKPLLVLNGEDNLIKAKNWR